jgi:hypothetical protein
LKKELKKSDGKSEIMNAQNAEKSPESRSADDLHEQLDRVQRRLRTLTVAVVLLTLAVFLCTAAVFGSLVNYFGHDVIMFGGATLGATLLGVGFGWFARGRK